MRKKASYTWEIKLMQRELNHILDFQARTKSTLYQGDPIGPQIRELRREIREQKKEKDTLYPTK